MTPEPKFVVSRRQLELLLDGLEAAIEAEAVEELDEAGAVHQALSYALVGLSEPE